MNRSAMAAPGPGLHYMDEPGRRASSEWHDQWAMFSDDEKFLFEEWIAPFTLEDFRGKTVLECGCGGGQHTAMIAPVASWVTAVDPNTIDIAKRRNRNAANVTFVEGFVEELAFEEQFDVVMCVGVIHHTDDPDRTFEAIFRYCRPGGKVIIWTYSAEGNAMVRYLVEPVRRMFLQGLERKTVRWISRVVTASLYPIVHSIYRIPGLSFLPYYLYFRNFRRMSFERNVLNVFDKLNAPQTRFTTHRTCKEWFCEERFEPETITIRRYAGTSYSLTGVKRHE